MRFLLFLSLIVSAPVFAAEQLFTEQPSVTPALAADGDYPVGVRTLSLTHKEQLSGFDFQSKQDRSLQVEVWYPATGQNESLAVYDDETRSGFKFSLQGKAHRDAALAASEKSYPLVVLSHGYTGYRTMMFYLAEHLASHGYVVAGIDHTDSTNAHVDFSKNGGSGFPSTLYHRARDQQFVMQQLMQHKDFAASLNESAAVVGYSMGGYGAFNTVGACYSFSPEFAKSLGMPESAAALFNSCNAGEENADPRWKAMIAIAPWGGEQEVHSAESMAAIKVPALIVAGDHDDVSGYENGVKRLYERLGSKDKYMLVYHNARHNIAAHPAPKAAYSNDLDIGHYYEPSWHSEAITRVNEHMVLAFLDCHLKAAGKGCDYLPQREVSTQEKQADGKLNEAWPGFPERWGTGMSFIRGR